MNHFTTNDGVRLAYTDEGTGRPVVLVAGYGAPAASWKPQAAALEAAGCRVIAFDRRSHGRSENPAYGQRLARHAMDLRELILLLQLEKPVLVGQSMGASTIMAYLSLFGDEELGGFVDIDQTPQMLNTDTWPHGMYGLNKSTMATFFDSPLPEATYRPLPPEMARQLREITLDHPPFDMLTTRPLLMDHALASWLDVLPRIEVPILFIAGANSPLWPAAHAKAAAEMCLRGKAVIIEECGHAVNWEQPAACNAALVAFLQKTI